MSDGRLAVILDNVCTQLFRIQLVFLIAVLFLVITIANLLVIEPGTPTHVVSAMNFVGLSVIVVVFGTVTYLCNNREP